MFNRKIVVAIVSSFFFALIFSLFGSSFFDSEYVNLFFNLYYLNLFFAITYGVAVSLFSDWISAKLFKKRGVQELVSFLLHCLFGVVLLTLSLVSVSLFFIVDRLLRKVTIRWWGALIAVGVAIGVFALLMVVLD